MDGKRNRRPATANASSGRKSRGSLTSFLDKDLTTKIYGESEKANRSTNDSRASSPKSFSPPMLQREPSRRTIRPMSALGALNMTEKKIREECTRNFADHWYLEGSDRFKTSVNHIVRENVFQVDKELISKDFSRPKSASYMSTYRTTVESPSKYPLPSLKPVMVRMSKIEFSEESDLLNIDHIRPGVEKSKYISLKLSEKTKHAYQQRKEERVLEATKSIQSSQSDKDLWFKRDQRQAEVNANDVLFLECLRKDVLPYPLKGVDKMMRQCVQFEDQQALLSSQENRRFASTAPLISTHIEEEESQTTAGMDADPSTGGQPAIHIIKSPNQSVVVPGTSVTDVRASSVLRLDLTERSIGNDRAICLADACQFCPSLQVLKIPNNRLNDYACAKLSFALLRRTQLTYLDMSENTLSTHTMELLGTYLANPNAILRHLDIGNCEISDELLGQFGQRLMTNQSLVYLSIRNNKLGYRDENNSLAFAHVIQQHPALQDLNLAGNFIRRTAARDLLRSLQDNRSLTKLNLASNQIQDASLLDAIAYLEGNRTLTELDLSHNRIESRGCIALSYLASRPTSAFRRLHLMGNAIGEMGYCFAMMMMREVAMTATRSPSNAPTAPAAAAAASTSSTTASASSPSRSRRGGGDILENDEDIDDLGKDTTVPPGETTPERLLHIFCEAKKCPEELGGLQFWNAWGKLQVNLQDPYERTVACYLLDRVNQHPFATIVDVKYYNPTIKAYEHPMLKRQADILTDTATNKATAMTTTSSSSSLEEVMRSLAHVLGVPSLPESVITTAYQHQETLRPWVQDPRGHGRLVVFLLQQVLMVWLTGNTASDVSAHGLLSSLKPTATTTTATTANTATTSATAHHPPPPLLSMFPTGSLAGCEITALESINRWLSEGNLYSQGHAIDRLKVIHLLMAPWLSHTIVETAVLNHRPPSPYMVVNAGGTFERWQLPTIGSLQWHLRMPESHGIQAFQWTDPSFQVMVRSFHRLPKENHSIGSYFYQVIDTAARTQENVLQATCVQAEWVLKHILKRRVTNHFEIIEKLLFQLSTPDETRRFLIRNLYFHEMAYIRKKLGVAFRVLTGNVTGHYVLDLSLPLHRFTARKLAAYSNYEGGQFPGLLNCRLGQCIAPNRMKISTTATDSSATQTRPTTAAKKPSAKDTSAAVLTTLTSDPRFTLFPKDAGAFHFRNPSYNGTYHPIDAEWILSSTSSMPDVGKVRFDFVSYDPQAVFMTPSMEFTGGNRIPITLPITPATEEADRVRRETFVDVLMNHVLQSSELFRYSAKLMEKKKLQPKNYHAGHPGGSGGQPPKKDSSGGGRANSLFEASLTSTDSLMQQLQPVGRQEGDGYGDEEGEDDEEYEEEEDEDENEDDNTSGANDQGSTITGQALSRASFRGGDHGGGGRMGRATFTKLQDQSEDIDTGVRQAFLRVQQMMAKQQPTLHPVDTLTSGDFMHQLTAASVPSPMANANNTTASSTTAAAVPSRGVIVTNVTQSSNNADAPQQPVPLSTDNHHHRDDDRPPSSLRKKKSNKPKIKRLMFRRNHTVYEKMFVAECTDWWRDFLESAHHVYVQRQRKHLMKMGAIVYKETLTSRELRALDGTKLERDAYPEEVYTSPAYLAAATIALYRLIDFPAYVSQQQTLKVTFSNAANALSMANSLPTALPSTETTPPTNGTVTGQTPAPAVTYAASQAMPNQATMSMMTTAKRQHGTMIGGGSFSQSIAATATNGGPPPASSSSSVAPPDRHEAFVARAIAHCLTFEDAFVALELFLLYNVWLDAFQVGCILRAFEQHFAQHRPPSGATGSLTREDASVTNHSAAGGSYASSGGGGGGGGGGNGSGQSTIAWTAQSIQELALVRVLSLLWPRIVDKGSPVLMATLQRHFPTTVWETIGLEIGHRLGWLSLWSPVQPWSGSPYVCDLAQGDQRYLAQQLCALIKDDPQLASLAEWQYQPSRLQAWQPQKPFNSTKPLVEPTTVLLNDGPVPVNLWPAVMKWPEKDLYPAAGLIKIIIHPPSTSATSSTATNSLNATATTASATSNSGGGGTNSEANWSKRYETQQRLAFHVVTPVLNQPELAQALRINASTKG